jgi:hypothetical protein
MTPWLICIAGWLLIGLVCLAPATAVVRADRHEARALRYRD